MPLLTEGVASYTLVWRIVDTQPPFPFILAPISIFETATIVSSYLKISWLVNIPLHMIIFICDSLPICGYFGMRGVYLILFLVVSLFQ